MENKQVCEDRDCSGIEVPSCSMGANRKRRYSETNADAGTSTPPTKKTTSLNGQQTEENSPIPGLDEKASDAALDEEWYNSDLFSLEHFCDEVLYEIFKFLDTWSLMTLMNVSKRFEKFVLDKRLWAKINLRKAPLPLGILEDMLERSHEKTHCVKIRGPSPSQHIECEIVHFNKTLRHTLTTRCTKLQTLELFGVTLDFKQLSFKDFPPTLERLVFSNCNVHVDANKSIFSGIDAILVKLKELAIENNAWFDPYYVMPIAKLPILRYLSLRGCSQMHEFIPYGSIAARHGFKKLEVLDLRDTPLNDSDLQCFNVVETLKEIYLQCPEEDIEKILANGTKNSEAQFTTPKKGDIDEDTPSTSQRTNSNSNPEEAPHVCRNVRNPSNSASPDEGNLPNAIPLVGSNNPLRSRFLPRPDHIIYLDCRNRNAPNAVHISLRDRPSLPGLADARNARQRQQSPPPAAFDQILRHNLFWDIINPLGRAAGGGGPDRLFVEDNEVEYGGGNMRLNPLSIFNNRTVQRASISDRGVCCFGRTREPVQHGVIWIRFNNRPIENRFERFSIRDYKSVTDTSLEHLVQCSPHLVFLDVSGTSVTMKGIELFKELKPECQVVAEHLLENFL